MPSEDIGACGEAQWPDCEAITTLNPFMQGKLNFNPQQVDQLLLGNSAEENSALRGIARLAYEVPPRILIAGSLYLAGHVLAINGTPPG